MKLEKWALVAEIISGFAVVVTLMIVVLGVRENTVALRATAAAVSRDSLASLNDLGVSLSEKNYEILMRSREPTTQWTDLTLVEQFWLRSFQRSFLQRAEAQYFRFENGLLDEDAWQTVRYRAWANISFSDSGRSIWREDRDRVYTPGFVEAIESYEPTNIASE